MKNYPQLFNIPFNIKYFHNENYLPDGDMKKYMFPGEEGEIEYHSMVKKHREGENNVLFNNIYVHYESCDCEYPCSHQPWESAITLNKYGNKVKIEFVDEGISIENENGYLMLNKIENITIGHFYQACQVLDIELELSEKAHDLFRFIYR